MIILLLVLLFCSFPALFTQWLHKHICRTSTGPAAHNRLVTTQGRTVAEKQFIRPSSCLKGHSLEVTVYILIQFLQHGMVKISGKKHPVALFDIHTIGIHKTDAWDNTENNMHDLNISCYSLCAPCLVRKKERGGETGEKKKILLAFVLFCLQGIKIVLPYALGISSQAAVHFHLH